MNPPDDINEAVTLIAEYRDALRRIRGMIAAVGHLPDKREALILTIDRMAQRYLSVERRENE